MSNLNIEHIKKFTRATNYLSAIQIFLKSNCLLESPLKHSDIKSRLLGHWGTCPGINFVYANLNYLIKKYNQDMMLVVGPGHGFPAIQSNLFIENTLKDYYPNATLTKEGIEYISKNFSWPYGFPSHASPSAPGVILEGGELGYSLSTSFGAVLDNPDLIVTCLVGDGEAETGPTATAWHINKFINPTRDGAVLPILHLNGYKISGPTIFGRMSDEELENLFLGYGYEPIFVGSEEFYRGVETDSKTFKESEEKVYQEMFEKIDLAYQKIKEIQKNALKQKEIVKPKWPMIILKTPKGWTSIEEFENQKIVGNHYSHQVVVKEPQTNEKELKALEKWLLSYKFEELFDQENGFIQEIKDLIPEENKKMGKSKYANGGPEVYKPLVLPKLEKFAENPKFPGEMSSSSMRRIGEYLNEVFKLNAKENNFRFFCPDETYSNKLDKIFENTERVWVWPIEKWDEDLSNNGRVMEMLSEHTLQGLMQGYVLTGRHGIFASYEAFIQIVSSMADQYAKFLHQLREASWRGTIPSFNYILTSSGWRQDHNGFSHQNPGFIDDMLQRQGDFINIYFPADGNMALAVIDKVLKDTNGINVIASGKQTEPRWLSIYEAEKQLVDGLAIWKFASQENPDIVFAAASDYLTTECLATIDLLKKELPEIKSRFVNVSTLSYSGFGEGGKVVPKEDLKNYFTEDKPVIFAFHGYPQTLKQILFDNFDNTSRFKVNGYIENGSTTTPFDMKLRNNSSRYNLIKDAINFLEKNGRIDNERAKTIIDKYNKKISEFKEYIKKFGVDPEEITNWVWEK